nr:hypothetical protein Iba_chr09fCG4380 [Ipomoea batatas]
MGQRKSKAWLEAGRKWVSILLEPPQECDVYATAAHSAFATQRLSSARSVLVWYGFKQFKSHKQNDISLKAMCIGYQLQVWTKLPRVGWSEASSTAIIASVAVAALQQLAWLDFSASRYKGERSSIENTALSVHFKLAQWTPDNGCNDR